MTEGKGQSVAEQMQIGRAHMAANRPREAAIAFNGALNLEPKNYEAALALAQAALKFGDFNTAAKVAAYAEPLSAGDRQWMTVALEAAWTKSDWATLENVGRRMSEVAPAEFAGWRALARGLEGTGRYGEALAANKKALSHMTLNGDLLAAHADIAMNALEFDAAKEALDKAEALEPESGVVLAQKALFLIYVGKHAEAEEICRRSIALHPEYLGPYPSLGLLRGGKLLPDEMAPLQHYSRKEGAPLPGRATASFLLAASYDAHGDVDKAFSEYQFANRLGAERVRKENLVYDPAAHAEWTDALIEVFPARPKSTGKFHEGPQPIFIVGLPRCGSTLVESVIAAHSRVGSGGEMPMLPPILIQRLRENDGRTPLDLTEEERRRFAEAYCKGLPKTDRAFVTDKNLLNIESAGLIAQVFPDSVIINVRRNPLECGLSIYRHDFLKFWNYTFNLKTIGHRYGLYARLTSHFEQTLEDRFFTIQYEDFIADTEKHARRLIEICGLDWEDACASPQSSSRIAATLSAVQVRQPIEKRAGKAKAYDAYLGPLRDALSEAGVDLETGALIAP